MTTANESDKKARNREHLAHELEAAAGGAAVGAVVGMIGGPIGAAAGAAVGGAAAALAEAMVEQHDEQTRDRNDELDEIIGVTAGEIGAPNLKHPPAKVGAYSAAAMGAAGAEAGMASTAEGPIQDLDGE
jgi:hypothetical protein